MNGLETALLLWGLFCTGLLILALGYIDVLKDSLDAERKARAADARVIKASEAVIAQQDVVLTHQTNLIELHRKKEKLRGH